MEGSRLRRPARWALPSPITGAWWLLAAIAAIGATIWFFAVRDLEPLGDGLRVHWALLGAGIFATEWLVIHLHFRSESGTFSLTELPLVLGLLFGDPGPAVVAMVAGAVLSLGLVRKQPPLKLAFNSANLLLHFALAFSIFPVFLGSHDPLSPAGWAAVASTTLLTGFINFAMIVLVIAITERRFDARKSATAVLFALAVAGANTAQALVAALTIVTEPWSAVLLVASTGVLFVSYRAYVSEREQREHVEFLYATTRSLREGGQSGSAIAEFLAGTATMFRAETVILHLFPTPDSGVKPVAFTHRQSAESDEVFAAKVVDEADQEAAQAVAAATNPPVLVEPVDRLGGFLQSGDAASTWVDAQGMSDAIVGALPAEDRIVGLLMIGERLGNVAAFTESDLRLFTTLTEHAALSLENDQLGQALVQLREMGHQLERQANHDELTGLANRAVFTSRLEDMYDDDTSEDGCVLYVDLDDFKPVNDTFGHVTGDELLVEVASRISKVVRDDDVPARLGGDEFAVVLPKAAGAESLARRLIATLNEPFIIDSNEIRIGASIGVAHRSRATSAAELVQQADTALYAAKEIGKGVVMTFGDDLRASTVRQQILNSDLRRAIAEEEFEVHYQPIIDLQDLSIIGAEALVRWRLPSGQIVSPADFIDEAEQSGLITSVDRLVRIQVLERLGVMREIDPEFFISANLSARHLRRPKLVDEIAADLETANAPADGLIIELTESALAVDTEAAAAQLDEIRQLGVRIALDDFGTGYSSLSYLRSLPVDLIKIARPFIEDMSAGDPTVVSAIVGLSQKLGFMTVAEGIDNEPAVGMLREMGCDLGQGYHFAHPMPADELEAFVSERLPTR